MEYTFSKNTMNVKKLLSEITGASFKGKFLHITTVGPIGTVVTSEELTVDEKSEFDVIVANHVPYDPKDNIKQAIESAKAFGEKSINDFTTENVMMGITQAGKTGEVSMYLHDLAHFLSTGSLYQAITEIDSMISQGIPESVNPFVSELRLIEYKAKIAEYLA